MIVQLTDCSLEVRSFCSIGRLDRIGDRRSPYSPKAQIYLDFRPVPTHVNVILNAMASDYKTVKNRSIVECTIRKSRFIGISSPASSSSALASFLNSVRSEHPDSSHVCFGAEVGAPLQGKASFSDDGEPGNTAGKPILHVIQAHECGNTAIAVVRYFGGVKLGAGALTRAYSNTASKVLNISELRVVTEMITASISCKFSEESRIRYILETKGITDLKSEYGNQLKLTFCLPLAQQQELSLEVINATSGDSLLIPIEPNP